MHISCYCYHNLTSGSLSLVLAEPLCFSLLDPLTKQTCSSSLVISQLSEFHSDLQRTNREEWRLISYFNHLVILRKLNVFMLILASLGSKGHPSFCSVCYQRSLTESVSASLSSVAAIDLVSKKSDRLKGQLLVCGVGFPDWKMHRYVFNTPFCLSFRQC